MSSFHLLYIVSYYFCTSNNFILLPARERHHVCAANIRVTT